MYSSLFSDVVRQTLASPTDSSTLPSLENRPVVNKARMCYRHRWDSNVETVMATTDINEASVTHEMSGPSSEPSDPA